MKKHSRIIFVVAACVAGLMTQSGAIAASTNSTWNLTAIGAISAGKIKDAETNSATAAFLSDGTFALLIGSDEFDGTYTNTTKALTLTFNGPAVALLESNVVDFVHSNVSPLITVSIKSSKLSKIKLVSGVPGKVTDKISGTGSITDGTKTRSKSFSFTYLLINWALASGTSF